GHAALAQEVGAAHFEPREVFRVVRDAHLVGLRVAHADGGAARARAHRAASSSVRTAAAGSPWPKTAEPATSTSAPAGTRERLLLASTPPSTSICALSPRSPICRCSRRTLSSARGRNFCP